MGIDAFISYSHRADGELAPALERGLQRLARPWSRLRAISVFRDQSDLSLTPHLWTTISAALDEARYLVLLACPESAASEWVNREIDHFCSTKGCDHVLIVVTGGELVWDDETGDFSAGSSAVAPALRGRFEQEPLYLDLRWARNRPELSLRMETFRAAVAQVASPIRGVPPDELEGEDVRLHRRARRLARSAVAGLSVLTIVAVIAGVLAVRSERTAVERARQAAARQLGLQALDLPVDRLDTALLTALAAARLDRSNDDRYRPVRTLIGDYSKLEHLVPVGSDSRATSVHALAMDSAGSEVAATVLSGDVEQGFDPSLIRATIDGSASESVSVPGLFGGVEFDDEGDVLVTDNATDALTVVGADAQMSHATGRVVAVRPELDRALLDSGGRLRIVELGDGFSGRDIGSTTAVFAITGSRVAVADEGAVTVWDIPSATPLASGELPDGIGTVDLVAVSADGSHVAAAGDDEVTLWSMRGQSLERRDGSIAIGPGGDGLHDQPLGGLFLSSDGGHLMVIGRTATTVFDTATGRALASAAGPVGLVSPDPSGRYVLVGGSRTTIWDLGAGNAIVVVPDPANAGAWSRDCAVSARCHLAVTGRSLDVWNLGGTQTRVRLADETNATVVAISGDGSRIASGGFGDTVAVWNTGVVAEPGEATEDVTLPGVGPSALDPTSGVRARVAGERVIVDGLTDSEAVVTTGPATRLWLLDGGRRLFVTASSARLFEVATGVELALDELCRSTTAGASPSGRYVVSYDPVAHSVAVCDASGTRVAAGGVSTQLEPVTALAVDDEGNVALGANGFISYLPRLEGRFGGSVAVGAAFAGERVVVSTVYLRDGLVVAGIEPELGSAGAGRVAVWPARSGSVPVVFDLDQPRVVGVSVVGAAGDTIVTATEDDGRVLVQMWDAATRRRLGRYRLGLAGDEIWLGGDEDRVVGIDASGRTLVWPLELDPGADVCDIVGRPLTQREWAELAPSPLGPSDYAPQC